MIEEQRHFYFCFLNDLSTILVVSRSLIMLCYNAMAQLVAKKDIYPFIDAKNPEVFSCKKYFQLNNSLSVNVIIKITAWSWRAMRDTRAMWNVWV